MDILYGDVHTLEGKNFIADQVFWFFIDFIKIINFFLKTLKFQRNNVVVFDCLLGEFWKIDNYAVYEGLKVKFLFCYAFLEWSV